MKIQINDRPNMTPIGQDRETLTFKVLLYLNVAVYVQVCRLFCVVYMPLFGLVQARPWFRSSIWISSVAVISKILCTSEIASATHVHMRMQDIICLKLDRDLMLCFFDGVFLRFKDT